MLNEADDHLRVLAMQVFGSGIRVQQPVLQGGLSGTVYVKKIANLGLNVSLWPNVLQVLGSLATLITLRLSASHYLASHLFLAMIASCLASLVALFHQFPYTILIWAPVHSVVAVYLVGRRWGTLWTIVGFLLMTLALFNGQYLGRGLAIQPGEERIFGVITMLMAMTAALWASLLFRKYIRSLLYEVRDQNIALLQHQKELEKVMEEKKTLLSVVCHDIGSPLSIVSYYSALAVRNPERGLAKLPKVVYAADLMTAMIQNVRDMEALDAGKRKVKLQPVDLAKVIERVHIVLGDRLEEKQLRLSVETEPQCSGLVMAEEVSLTSSVINNLLSNAIKFSEPGTEIRVDIYAEAESIKLVITDRGMGIPAEIIPYLFDRGKATSRPGTQGERGTGFGLPIVKAYMNRYGGSIEVHSVPKAEGVNDHGTTFTLVFVAAASEEGHAA
jgi:signal transduction histidine kinase